MVAAKQTESCQKHLYDGRALCLTALSRLPPADQRLSPYVCPWCRNGLSLNEAHKQCLASGRLDRFWPAEGATLAGARAVPIREIATGQIGSAERQVLAWFYLYLLVGEKQLDIVRCLPTNPNWLPREEP